NTMARPWSARSMWMPTNSLPPNTGCATSPPFWYSKMGKWSTGRLGFPQRRYIQRPLMRPSDKERIQNSDFGKGLANAKPFFMARDAQVGDFEQGLRFRIPKKNLPRPI